MLKKEFRLTTEQVSAVMEKGKSFHSPFFTIRILTNQKKAGLAAIVSKKIGKTAVARNYGRKKVYEALMSANIHKQIKSGIQVAILCKDKTTQATIKELAGDLLTLFKKASVL